MKSRIIQFIPVVISIFGVIFAKGSYWCVYSSKYCYATLINQIYADFTNPLYNFLIFIFPIAIILIFVSREVFNSWAKFAKWALPIAFFLVAGTQVSSMVPMDFLPFYRDDAARLMGETVTILSLVVIAFASIRARSYVAQESVDALLKVRELAAAFAAFTALIAVGIFFWASTAQVQSAIEIFLLAGVISIGANLYALYRTLPSLYITKQKHLPLGKELVAALALLSLNAITYLLVGTLLFAGMKT